MTSEERILAATNLQQPDMVPVFELEISASLLQPISEILFGEKDFKSNKNRLHEMTAQEQKDYLQSFCKIIDALGLDGITEGPANPAQQVDAEHIKDVYGNIRVLNPHGMAMVVRGAVESPAELKSYKLPPPKEQDFDHMELINSQLPDMAMTLRVEDTFKAAWELRGSMQNYRIDYYEQPDFIKEISTRMGSDLLTISEVIGSQKQIQDPFTGETMIAVRAIEPDVAIIHAQKADEFGNVRIEGPFYEDVIKAKAAKKVVVTESVW